MKRVRLAVCAPLLLSLLAAGPALAADPQDDGTQSQKQDCSLGADQLAGAGPIQGGRQLQPSRGEVEERLSAAGCKDQIDQSDRDAKDVDRIYKQLMGEDAKGGQ